jgi:hypothetical protein
MTKLYGGELRSNVKYIVVNKLGLIYRLFAKGFTATNLKTIRKFYGEFLNGHALRD